MFSVLFLTVCLPLALAGDDCTAPDLTNGQVSSTGNANNNVATFSCNKGFNLVGKKLLKCMAGRWFGDFPICIAFGICDPKDSPVIAHGRKLRKFRGAVYKVKCDRDFKRYGPMYITCEGSEWNYDNLPICIRDGCDENELSNIEYGQAKSMMKGAMYKFKCDEGTTMDGSDTLYCDGSRWNGTAPRCVWPRSPPDLGVAVDGTMTSLPLSSGQTATVTCQSTGGHPEQILTLYKNSQPLGSPQQYQTSHTFTVAKADNAAVFQCEAQDETRPDPQVAELRLEVHWPASPPSLELIVDGVTSSGPVVAGQTVMILCQSKGGHPHPNLSITRNGQQEVEARQFRNTHTFTVRQDDNNAVFQCSAINQQMNTPEVSEIVLDVHYGPTAVTLDGLDETIAGRRSPYSCESSRSNPPAEIHWTATDRNGHEITDILEVFESTTSWDGYGWLTASRLVLSPSLPPAVTSVILRCTATNLQTSNKVAQKKWVTVQYGPEKVMVTGPVKVRYSDSVTLECMSSPSVPESSLRWRVEQAGHALQHPEPRGHVHQEEDGSFITRSVLTVPAHSITGSDIVAECYATNAVLGNDFRAYAHVVEVISPPSMLMISGIDSGVAVPFGSSQSLTCSAQAGSPPAKLHWYRGDEMMQAHYEVEGDRVKAQITFVPHDDDTELRCEAVNEALSEPISSSIKIAVDAPPESTPDATFIESVSPTILTHPEEDEPTEEKDEYLYPEYPDEYEDSTENNEIDSFESDGTFRSNDDNDKEDGDDNDDLHDVYDYYSGDDGDDENDENSKEKDNEPELVEVPFLTESESPFNSAVTTAVPASVDTDSETNPQASSNAHTENGHGDSNDHIDHDIYDYGSGSHVGSENGDTDSETNPQASSNDHTENGHGAGNDHTNHDIYDHGSDNHADSEDGDEDRTNASSENDGENDETHNHWNGETNTSQEESRSSGGKNEETNANYQASTKRGDKDGETSTKSGDKNGEKEQQASKQVSSASSQDLTLVAAVAALLAARTLATN